MKSDFITAEDFCTDPGSINPSDFHTDNDMVEIKLHNMPSNNKTTKHEKIHIICMYLGVYLTLIGYVVFLSITDGEINDFRKNGKIILCNFYKNMLLKNIYMLIFPAIALLFGLAGKKYSDSPLLSLVCLTLVWYIFWIAIFAYDASHLDRAIECDNKMLEISCIILTVLTHFFTL